MIKRIDWTLYFAAVPEESIGMVHEIQAHIHARCGFPPQAQEAIDKIILEKFRNDAATLGGWNTMPGTIGYRPLGCRDWMDLK
jgi:hypothetical protein